MNIHAIIHEPKSSMCYAYDDKTLHLRLKTARGDIEKVTARAVDPFNWVADESGNYVFDYASIAEIPMRLEGSTELYDVWFAEVSGEPWYRIRYAFIAESGGESYVIGCNNRLPATKENVQDVWNYYSFPYINGEDVYSAPDWVKDTVWYEIFPERFRRSKDNADCLPWGEEADVEGAADVYRKFGGDLQGVIDMLSYIKSLGVNGIYFTPIFAAPSTHKYDPSDYFTIDPDFGDNEKFGELVKQAHGMGIRVMLDAVYNHCGEQHPFWLDVLENGAASQYADCFYIVDKNKPVAPAPNTPERGLNYRTFAFTLSMPKWNTENQIARKYLLDSARYWIEKYDIDGWRLDVCNEVSHAFWRDFRKVVKGIKPDLYTVGEIWTGSYPWLMGDQFDAVMNYGFMNAVWGFIGTDIAITKQKLTATQFARTIDNLLTQYPRHTTQYMFNLLESHDTARFMTVCGENASIALLGYVLLLTFTGTPAIYYGGEVGIGGNQHNNRKCMVWDTSKQDLHLQSAIKKLIAIRSNHSACHSIDIEWLQTNDDTGCVLFKKQSESETLYAAINNSTEPRTIALPSAIHGQNFTDILNEQSLQAPTELNLPPYGFMLLMCDK